MTDRFKNIGLLRFIFAIMIVIFHTVCLNSMLCKTFVDDIPMYAAMVKHCKYSWVCVEFFLIMAGFFLATRTNFKTDFFDFVKKKFLRLWPVLAFAIGLYFVLSLFTPLGYNKYSNLFALLLIQNCGLTHVYSNVHQSWFVSALFWSSIFYFYIIKYVPKPHKMYLIGFITMLAFAFGTHANGKPIDNIYLVFNYGIMRAIACLGLGILIGYIYIYIYITKDILPNNKPNILKKVFYTAAEIYLFCYILYYQLFHVSKSKDIYLVFIIAFSFLFWLFLLKKGWFSKLLENNICDKLGQYSYGIFIMHSLALDLLKVYIWTPHREFVIQHPIFNLILPIICSTIMGVIAYHLVEKPAAKYLKNKWFAK